MPFDIKRHKSPQKCVCATQGVSPPETLPLYKEKCILISKVISFLLINKLYFYSYFTLCLKIVKYHKMIVRYQKSFLDVPFDIKGNVLEGVYKK